ncbi:MAG: hypothetical protein HZA54_14190 [Planctomycetes bacterium]|nr:hypothetical protein [Planctomycetota bacterium]
MDRALIYGICLVVVFLLTTVAGARGFAQDAAPPPPPESVKLPTPRGTPLEAVLHRPARANGVAVVLAPGQGYHKDRPLVKRSAEALAAAGFVAVRFDWAYFTANGQPSDDLAAERSDAEAALAWTRTLPGVTKLVLAGKSLGSLVALARAAAKADDLAGLALLTFPLHAPDQPAPVRPGTEALAGLTLPTLVVCGDRDPLCQVGALYALAAKCRPTVRVVIVPGDHGLTRGKEDDSETEENVGLAAHALVVWARRFGGV